MWSILIWAVGFFVAVTAISFGFGLIQATFALTPPVMLGLAWLLVLILAVWYWRERRAERRE